VPQPVTKVRFFSDPASPQCISASRHQFHSPCQIHHYALGGTAAAPCRLRPNVCCVRETGIREGCMSNARADARLTLDISAPAFAECSRKSAMNAGAVAADHKMKSLQPTINTSSSQPVRSNTSARSVFCLRGYLARSSRLTLVRRCFQERR
jgi:hypothetical protein